MSAISDALAALIAAAKQAGLSPEETVATLVNNWDTGATTTRPKLDEWGRMKVQGRWLFAPFPLIEKWEGLTDLQIGHMRVNCSVDALGRWKYEKDGKTVYVPSAFSGFSEGSPLSFLSATKFEVVENDDGTKRWKPLGHFPEQTLRSRFASYADVLAYKFQGPVPE